MKCAEILLRLEDYSYGELSDLESITIAAHLRDCSSCSEQYQIILTDNEVFADYLPNIEVSSSLWAGIQERISSKEPIEIIQKSKGFPQIQNFLVIKPNSIQFTFLDNQSIWRRLTKVLQATLKDFTANPRLFCQQLFQEDNLFVRDKKYWQVGRNIALVLWLFSTISYVSVFQELPRGFKQRETLEKIVDLAPLPFPKELIPKEPKSIVNKQNKPPSLNTKIAKGSLETQTNRSESKETTNFPTNIPILPNISTQRDLPDSSLPNLTFGIPNNTNTGVFDGSGVGSGKTSSSGLGLGQTGMGNGNSSMSIGDEIVYNAYDTSIVPVRILSKEKPSYTEEARREKIAGKVILSVVFNKNGNITNIQVIKGLGYGLDEQAIKTASQVRFIPATRNGISVSVNARLEYTFTVF